MQLHNALKIRDEVGYYNGQLEHIFLGYKQDIIPSFCAIRVLHEFSPSAKNPVDINPFPQRREIADKMRVLESKEILQEMLDRFTDSNFGKVMLCDRVDGLLSRLIFPHVKDGDVLTSNGVKYTAEFSKPFKNRNTRAMCHYLMLHSELL